MNFRLLKDPTVSFEIVDAMFSAIAEDVNALVVPYLPHKAGEVSSQNIIFTKIHGVREIRFCH